MGVYEQIQELYKRRDNLIDERKKLEKQMSDIEIDPYDFEDVFCDMLDEEPTIIAGMEYQTSRVLEEVDPTAYRCGLVDWVDSAIDVEDTEEYKELIEELENLESEIEDIEDAISDLEDELEDEDEE